ncbi:MAG: hypothetical protein R2798_05960 [Chitinophagales bacterium]
MFWLNGQSKNCLSKRRILALRSTALLPRGRLPKTKYSFNKETRHRKNSLELSAGGGRWSVA